MDSFGDWKRTIMNRKMTRNDPGSRSGRVGGKKLMRNVAAQALPILIN